MSPPTEAKTIPKRQRWLMARQTKAVSAAATRAPASAYPIRQMTGDDAEAFGHLLYAGYHGSIDDEGETPEESMQEARGTLAGKYGEVLWKASFVALDGDLAVSATVITDYVKTGPLLAFSVTRPDYQRRGLARCLIEHSLRALNEQGIETLSLVVTVQNHGAVRLYRQLGFRKERNAP